MKKDSKMYMCLNLIARKIFPWKSVEYNLYDTYLKYSRRAKTSLKKQYYSHKIYKKYHCHVSPWAKIGEGTIFPHPIGIVIGKNVKMGRNCAVYQNVTIGRRSFDNEKMPQIGNNVTICCNAIILGDIVIEDDAIIGAGAIVLRDVKRGEVVHGVSK